MFANTLRGAKASVAVWRLIETARANGLEPFAYLRHIGGVATLGSIERSCYGALNGINSIH